MIWYGLVHLWLVVCSQMCAFVRSDRQPETKLVDGGEPMDHNWWRTTIVVVQSSVDRRHRSRIGVRAHLAKPMSMKFEILSNHKGVW